MEFNLVNKITNEAQKVQKRKKSTNKKIDITIFVMSYQI